MVKGILIDFTVTSNLTSWQLCSDMKRWAHHTMHSRQEEGLCQGYISAFLKPPLPTLESCEGPNDQDINTKHHAIKNTQVRLHVKKGKGAILQIHKSLTPPRPDTLRNLSPFSYILRGNDIQGILKEKETVLLM